MTEASEGQRTISPESSTSGQGSSPGTDGSTPGTTGASGASAPGASTPATGKATAKTAQAAGKTAAGSAGPSAAALGPFTLRELFFGAGVVIVFVGTLLPFIDGMVRYANFWNSVPLFFIGIGILLPVIALALLAGRRLGSSGLRVGSLSVDQFASVAAVLAATYFFLQTVTAFHTGPLVALIGSLLMLAATVVGPFLPVFRNDFADRPEVPAHAAARPITAARPRPPKPAKPAAAAKTGPSAASRSEAGQAGVNPAAATVLQNGAGLYGAGGAGAVGAGAAASGQSGMERGESPSSSTTASAHGSSSASHTPRHVESGAHAVGSDEENGVQRTQDGHRPSPDRSSDATSSQPTAEAVDETRVQDAVDDDATRTSAPAASAASVPEERRQEPITATRSADEETVVEAFWFAVGSSRPVFDEQTGRQVFTLQPGDWEVGIEDRGSEFLVQDKRTGAVGILRDLRNIERAPRD